MRKYLFLITMILTALAFAGCDNGTSSQPPKIYTVTFNAEGGTFTLSEGDPAIIKVQLEEHKEIGTLPPQPEKKGFSFGGWWTEKTAKALPFWKILF